MTKPEQMQVEMTQPLGCTVAALCADVRPLRAMFEELALAVRHRLQSQGVTDPALAVTIDLRYPDQAQVLTIELPLEVENGAICLADPLPLDAQALRQALESFAVLYAERFGSHRQGPLQAVRLRVTGCG